MSGEPGAAQVVLAGFTAGLVVVTARYAIQTPNLVTETKKSREEAEKDRKLAWPDCSPS